MNGNLAIFLIMTVSIVAAMIVILAGMRSRNARHRATAQAPEIGQLTSENGALRGQVARLEERLAVLERIATDPAERTAREIELLR
jgi:uncharacterized protein (UPF0548 family)